MFRLLFFIYILPTFCLGGLKLNVGIFPSYEGIKKTFSIVNTLNRNLVVSNVRSNCSCLTVIFDKRSFSAEEKITGTVMLDKNELFGQFTKKVFISDEDHSFDIEVLGTAKVDFKITPGRGISCGFIDINTTKKTSFFIKSLGSYSVKMPKQVKLKGSVDLLLEKQDDGLWNCTVTPVEKGLFKTRLEFPVKGKKRPPVRVVIFGVVK